MLILSNKQYLRGVNTAYNKQREVFAVVELKGTAAYEVQNTSSVLSVYQSLYFTGRTLEKHH